MAYITTIGSATTTPFDLKYFNTYDEAYAKFGDKYWESIRVKPKVADEQAVGLLLDAVESDISTELRDKILDYLYGYPVGTAVTD